MSPSLGTHDSGARSGLTAGFHLFGSLVWRAELNVFVEMKSQIRDSQHGNDDMSSS